MHLLVGTIELPNSPSAVLPLARENGLGTRQTTDGKCQVGDDAGVVLPISANDLILLNFAAFRSDQAELISSVYEIRMYYIAVLNLIALRSPRPVGVIQILVTLTLFHLGTSVARLDIAQYTVFSGVTVCTHR